MQLSSGERLGLGLFVGTFSLLQGFCGAVFARKLKLSMVVWFLMSAIPCLGVFALLALQSQLTTKPILTEAGKAFEPVALNYRIRWFRMIGGMLAWVFIGFPLLNKLPLHRYVIMALWLMGGLVVVILLYPHLPDCPECKKKLGALFGRFCPQCQGNLNIGGAPNEAYCPTCAKMLCNQGGKRGRNFRIRGCTHCGALLDDSGLD